jgi:ribosomal-protein-alanine N-acetyltransferase
MPEEIIYRNATKADLIRIAEIFMAAFPESINHYIGHPIAPLLLADIFAICLDSEPGAFFVAETGGRAAGYIFAPACFERIPRTAVLHGHIFRIFLKWVMGRYNLGLRPVRIAIKNWMQLLAESRRKESACNARILSIAVDPEYQGLHIGSKLLLAGLNYLKSLKIKQVRLEVRPENAPAVHLYEKFGFKTKGRTHDTQGDWLIMLKDNV